MKLIRMLAARIKLMEINIWLVYLIFITALSIQYLVLLKMKIWGRFKRDVHAIPTVLLIFFCLWVSSLDGDLYEYSGYIMLAITVFLFINKVKKDGDGLW